MSKFKPRERKKRALIEQEPHVYGQSLLGADLEVFLPSRDPELLIFAGIHGEESETTLVTSYALREIKATDLRAAVITAANPDGLARATRANAAGVDLNRNFPSSTWSPKPSPARWTTLDERDMPISPGESPLDQPESAALAALVEELSVKCVISLHAPLADIKDHGPTPLGRWIAERTGMELVKHRDYATNGSFDSWAREKAHLTSITYELGIEDKYALRARHCPVLIDLMRGEHPAV